jgi:hypothetical protein
MQQEPTGCFEQFIRMFFGMVVLVVSIAAVIISIL